MKCPTKGRFYYAADYKEFVLVISVVAPARDRCVVRRANGQTTSNYPAYLLRVVGAKWGGVS